MLVVSDTKVALSLRDVSYVGDTQFQAVKTLQPIRQIIFFLAFFLSYSVVWQYLEILPWDCPNEKNECVNKLKYILFVSRFNLHHIDCRYILGTRYFCISYNIVRAQSNITQVGQLTKTSQ